MSLRRRKRRSVTISSWIVLEGIRIHFSAEQNLHGCVRHHRDVTFFLVPGKNLKSRPLPQAIGRVQRTAFAATSDGTAAAAAAAAVATAIAAGAVFLRYCSSKSPSVAFGCPRMASRALFEQNPQRCDRAPLQLTTMRTAMSMKTNQ